MKFNLKKVALATWTVAVGFTAVAQGVNLEWAKQYGGSKYDEGRSVFVDKERNVYTTGTFADTADFNTGSKLIASGGTDIFVSKQDPTGATVWVKRFGGSGNDAGSGIVLDTAGNIYITGAFSDTVDFNEGGTPLTLVSPRSTNVFVLKLDKDGATVWASGMGGTTSGDEGTGIALDAAGNVYTVGIFFGTADFDPGPATANLTNAGSSDIFVSKLNASGAYVWAKGFGGNRLDRGEDIAVDAWGNVYTTGYFMRTADFDPGTNVVNLISGGNTYDAFISKLSTDGDFVWAKQISGANPVMANGIALDDAANVYTTGMFNATTDFDPGTANFDMTSAGGTDIYVSKLDSSGSFVWARQMGGSPGIGGDRGYDIDVDHKGNVYSTGFFHGTADFDPGSETYELTAPAGAMDIYVSKLNTSGNFVWAKQLTGSSNTKWGIGIEVDGSGNVYTTGHFSNSTDFDPGPGNFDILSYGGSDIYIHKLVCIDTSSSHLEIVTGCQGYDLNGQTYTEPGSYTVMLTNNAGCDSTVTLSLSIELPEAFITVDEFTLGTTEVFDTYQWLFNDQQIPGATDSTYTVSENGNYRVVVTDQYGCIDTSAIYAVTNVPVGIGAVNNAAAQVKIYPNPATDMIYVAAPFNTSVSITTIEGKLIKQEQGNRPMAIGSLAEGMYLLHIATPEGRVIKVEKLIKKK